MKKLLVIAISILLLVCILTGCTPTLTADLPTILEDINSTYGFESMTEIGSTGELSQYYLIDISDVKSFAAEFSTGSTITTEIVLVEAVNDASAQNIYSALQNYYETRVDMAQSYDPEYAKLLGLCDVTQNGVYVSLIISDKVLEITETYNSYFE